MKVIGLTGGIACGKSTATKRFQERKVPVIDTDQVARQLLTHHPDIQTKVQRHFGTLDRARLRELVFGHEDERRKLEEILHPEIYRVVQDRLRDLGFTKPRPKLVLVAVPLLFEARWEPFFHYTVAVICEEKQQMDRLVARDGITPELAQHMIKAQLSNAEKSARANFTLENDGDLASFEQSVDRLIDELEATT